MAETGKALGEAYEPYPGYFEDLRRRQQSMVGSAFVSIQPEGNFLRGKRTLPIRPSSSATMPVNRG